MPLFPRKPIHWPALASGFAAALALAVSTYNVYLQRQQIGAQVWPHLEWSSSNVGGFAFHLNNRGVGPATLGTVRVTVDGRPVKTWAAALDRAAGVRSGYVTGHLTGRVFSAGAAVEPLRITDPAAIESFEPHAGRIAVELCYCSALGDCWRHHSSSRTEVVDDCPPVDGAFEQ